MLNNDINSTKQTKIKLINILGQELSLDQIVTDKVKLHGYIKKAKIYLN